MLPGVVLGCGSGRCGTVSLNLLLSKQDGFRVTHEYYTLPWELDLTEMWRAYYGLTVAGEGFRIAADVAFYWLNYIPEIAKHAHDPKCVCLKRDKTETIESFIRWSGCFNLWNPKFANFPLAKQWPKYKLPLPQALGRYWDEYYEKAHAFEKRYPYVFKVVDMNWALNTEEGQHTILRFLGVPENERILDVGLKDNTKKQYGQAGYIGAMMK